MMHAVMLAVVHVVAHVQRGLGAPLLLAARAMLGLLDLRDAPLLALLVRDAGGTILNAGSEGGIDLGLLSLIQPLNVQHGMQLHAVRGDT